MKQTQPTVRQDVVTEPTDPAGLTNLRICLRSKAGSSSVGQRLSVMVGVASAPRLTWEWPAGEPLGPAPTLESQPASSSSSRSGTKLE